MSFEGQVCIDCESKDVFKIPSLLDLKKPTSIRTNKVGAIVEDYIKETKKEIEKEKKELKSKRVK